MTKSTLISSFICSASLITTDLCAQVYSCGVNVFGQLGVGNLLDSEHPLEVPLPNTIALSTGGRFTLALGLDGTVWRWGLKEPISGHGTVLNSTPELLPEISNAVAIAAGHSSSLIATADSNIVGVARGATMMVQLRNDGTLIDPSLTNVLAIACGSHHGLALLNDGTVRAWGQNFMGQIGDGTTVRRPTPVPVLGLTNVVAIGAGGQHSLAVLADGTVRAWGHNAYGQLGDGACDDSLVPVEVAGLTNVLMVVGGGRHSLALKSGGEVYAWGGNTYGQLGDGTHNDRNIPAIMPLPKPAFSIAAGGFVSMALTGPNPLCRGDITFDRVVGVPDLLAVISAWGTCPEPPNYCAADIAPPGPPIGDGAVGVPDLLAVISAWGPCP